MKDVFTCETDKSAGVEVNWNANNNGMLFVMVDDYNAPCCTAMHQLMTREQAIELRDFLNQLPL